LKTNEHERNDIRMSFDIPAKLHDRLKDTVPWGVKSKFLVSLIEIAVKRLEQANSGLILGGILRGDLDPFQKVERKEE